MTKHRINDEALNHLKSMVSLGNLTGRLIEERYQVLDLVGEGGMGQVYLARDQKLQRDIAVKVIGEQNVGGELVDRFVREIKAMAGLQHPNIVPVYDSGQLPDGRLYYTMKFIDGRDLGTVIRNGEAMPKLLEVFAKVCRAVGFAHQQGFLHRDLKPGNILIDAAGEPYVLDWGLVKFLKSLEQSTKVTRQQLKKSGTQVGLALGTPYYMSPEQASGSHVDPLTDVYALGSVLYEILTRRHPFQGEDPQEVINRIMYASPTAPRLLEPSLPSELEAICLKAMEKLPHKRYADVSELEQDVQKYLRDEPVAAWHTTALARALKRLRRYRSLIVACAVILLLSGGTVWLVKTLIRISKRKDELITQVTQEDRRREAQKAAQPHLDRGRDRLETARRKLEHAENFLEVKPVLQDAVHALSQAIELDSENAESYRLRGLAQFDLRSYGAAEEDLSRAVALNPDVGLARFNRGIVALHEYLFSAVRVADLSDSRLKLRGYMTPRQLALRARIVEDLKVGADALKEERYRDLSEASLALVEGHFDATIARLNEMATHDSTDPTLYVVRAVAHAELAHWDLARADLRRANELVNCLYEVHLLDALIRAATHQSVAAVACCDAAARVNPQDVRIHLYRAVASQLAGNTSSAVSEAAAAAEQARADPQVRLVEAVIRAQAGQLRDARDALTVTLDADPNNVLLLAAMGRLAYALEDYGGTISLLDRALTNATPDAELFFMRGRCHVRMSDADSAIRDLTRAIDLDDRFAEAFFERGRLFLHQGRFNDARKDLLRAADLDPNDVRYLVSLGTAYDRSGDREKARVSFTRALQRDAECVPAFIGRARVHLEDGDDDAAVRDASTAIQLQRNNADAHHLLGYAEYRRGNTQKGLAELSTSLTYGDLASAHAHRAEIWMTLGLPNNAVQDLTAAIELGQKDAPTLVLRGNALFALHKYGPALDDWYRAGQLDPAVAAEYAEQFEGE